MAQKPSIPKGTRDFTPSEVVKRNYIFDIIKKNFQTFGFQPIETPSFENSDTLMGKYGDEGDRLIFKILNSGDFLRSFNENLIKTIKLSLYHLRIYLNGTVKEEMNSYGLNFVKVLPEILRKDKQIKFDESVIDLNNLANDLWNKIEVFVNKEDWKEVLINGVDEDKSLTNLSIGIFGEFYFEMGTKYLGSHISEKALRYDLTVPFARYVVMHQNEIDFPFKRYQIQPVWRADRPQKGRFREFYQCDADVVGSNSLLQEVEFVQLYDAVFSALKLEGVTIKLNNRKILAGIAEVIGAKNNLIDFTVALDKLDKIGEEGVKKEMLEKGISEASIEKAAPLFSLSGTNNDQLNALEKLLAVSEEGSKGVQELRFIIDAVSDIGLSTAQLAIDVTLARGLNYYTGAIFEVAAPKSVQMGSIGGGGRYDDLTGIFGLKDVSGVGISFGLDRIYLVLEELDLFPEAIDQSLQVLFMNYGEAEAFQALKLVTLFRKNGVKADLYPDSATNQKQENKQFKFATNKNVPYIVIIREDELKSATFTVKNINENTQETYSLDKAEEFLKNL
ncbi:histidine--tRNA ligase [Cellulophaga tyrosinoxydans]|uniref:Histidine--tRNA ligase n=1 Tax=Cellulophaga tyrosinoxydans TaxID=504486 RepID=A0A1W2CKR9_9FLAO|nr:histidine--tRNA ligase [Cellulophaga tyrosinoxydans]SMC85825.1 histidyl-tRNA synthetase [Cellulophaga tyrosinoxydans]